MLLDADSCVIENLGRVFTCRGDALVDDPCVAVENGRVVYAGPRAGCTLDASMRVDGRGLVLTPGLIDCHTHPAFVRARADEFAMRMTGASYEEIATAGGGILSSTVAVRGASLHELTQATARNFARLRAHGVVALEGKSGYGLSLEAELNQLRAIRAAGETEDMHNVRTCLAAHSLPAEFRGDAAKRAEYLRLVRETILPQVAREDLAQRADVFCERGVFTPEETRAVAEVALALGLRVTIHAEQLSDSGGALVAAEVGADSADHLEFVSDAATHAMREAGVAAVLLPGSTYALKMSQWADGRRLLDAGLAVALATDFNPGSSPIANPAFVMNLAVMHCGLTPDEALAGFMSSAAKALRLDENEWGVIKPGSRAAFALWDVDHEHEISYYAGSNLCVEVITCRGWRS